MQKKETPAVRRLFCILKIDERGINKMAGLLLIIIFIMYIGLGIPDSLFGTAWPAIYRELDLPVGSARYVTSLISAGTIVSSFFSASLLRKFGTGLVTFFSVVLTALGLFGFSVSSNMVYLLFSAIPLGLGAGAIDTGLNHYVAMHYKASHLSFLHCFYGVGVTLRPYLMSLALASESNWRGGYQKALVLQGIIAFLSFVSLPLWKKAGDKPVESGKREEGRKESSLGELVRRRTVILGWAVFFCSCAIEFTCGIWGSTFLVETGKAGVDKAAQLTTFYYAGMAVGRGISGFLVSRMTEWSIIFTGQTIVGISIMILFLPLPSAVSGAALFCIGLGNGPIFPNLTYLTPANYGIEKAAAAIGSQAVASNLGILLAPFLFGIIIPVAGVGSFPWYLFGLFVVMLMSTWRMSQKLKRERGVL